MKLFWPLLILTLNTSVFSQDEEIRSQRAIHPEDLPQKVQLMPGQEVTNQNDQAEEISQPTHLQGMENPTPLSDDEAMLQQIEEDRNRQIEAAVRVGNTTDKVFEGVTNVPEELKKLGFETFNSAAMMDERVIGLMKKMLVNSPLQKMSPLEVRSLILEKVKGRPMESFLLNHPKVLGCMVDLLRDKQALPSAVGLFLKRDQLKLYAGIWLCLMIMAWLGKKIWFKKDWTLLKVRLMGIVVSLSVSMISLTTFYNLFHDEVSPSVKLIIKHWRHRNLPDVQTRMILPESNQRKIS